MLAERGTLEDRVDDDGEAEVAEHEPRRRARLRPQVEELVEEEHEDQQCQAEPFTTQPSRPAKRWMNDAPADIACEHHRACRAKQIADGHDGDNEEPAPMNGRDDRREVAWRELRTEEAVQHDRHSHDQQHELQGESRMSPSQERADDRPRQHIHVGFSTGRLRVSVTTALMVGGRR